MKVLTLQKKKLKLLKSQSKYYIFNNKNLTQKRSDDKLSDVKYYFISIQKSCKIFSCRL